ncbi:MAG: lipid kinase [Coleofasciculus chthonoplastes F3-SA18-01]|jgi:diacylglycerol kinase (ATP)|uniref:lipid kinase n=1 Tax=Coleofasciculus chthonoplastes TaxID=64178 RepID=UPI0032F90AB0
MTNDHLQLPPKTALLLINRKSRHGQENLVETIRQLKELGFIVLEELTEDPLKLPDIIRHYQHQVDLVIIGGGDGTLNAAIEGLVDTQLPLGILPLGTANDLARTLKIPVDLPQACQVIATGQYQRIDLGLVNEQYFFNVASCGLSVEITQRLTKEDKSRWGILAYLSMALKMIWQARPFRAEIRINGEAIRIKTIQIAIGNGRHYGGGMTVCYDAKIDDQRLDLYSLEMRHWWHILLILPALWRGRHADLPGVRTLQGTEFEIYTRKPRSINTDGEITTSTPATFRVIPQVISVVVPR